MTMKTAEAQNLLGLNSPFDKESIAQAWVEARNRANAQARLNIEGRRVLPETLKTIDQAKVICEQALQQQPKTAPPSGGWAPRQTRHSRSRKAARFSPFAQNPQKRSTPFSQSSPSPPASVLNTFDLKRTILQSFLLSIPFTIVVNLILFFVLGGSPLSGPLTSANVTGLFGGNQSSVKFLSDVPVQVELINSDTGARYRCRTPMTEPLSCPAGLYEIQVSKDGVLWERSQVNIQPGTSNQIPIR